MRFLVVILYLSFGSGTVMSQRTGLAGVSAGYPYLAYYGNWTNEQVSFARDHYRLVILHPTVSNVSPAQIADIQSGPDRSRGTGDDVLVLGYISAGEDGRPGAPFPGNGQGPRVDPRPPGIKTLRNIDADGRPSPGGSQYASYYLDDGVLQGGQSIAHDGLPDRNSAFGGYYVNAGDAAWQEVLRNSTKATEGKAGILELLTRRVGAGYGCDGLLVDTLDVAAPNSYGTTQYEWTAPGLSALLHTIAADFPDKVMMGNRGLFFHDPNLEHYRFSPRAVLNAVLFEGYYTDSNSAGRPSPFFLNNRSYLAPKLNAESQRPDGFSIFSLDYYSADDPGIPGPSAYRESQLIQGWPLYRTTRLVNATPFRTESELWNEKNPDLSAPAWDSTFSSEALPGEARTGLQEVVPGDGEVTLRWDVARDQSGPVGYNIYYSASSEFRFDTATKVPRVKMTTPWNYSSGSGPRSFPFEYTVRNLANGVEYCFAVRAEDRLGHEEVNEQVLRATPRGIFSQFVEYPVGENPDAWEGIPPALSDPVGDGIPDIVSVKVANDLEHFFIRVEYNGAVAVNTFEDSPSLFLSLDRDRNPATGYDIYGRGIIGTEVSWQNRVPFLQSRGNFNTGEALEDAVPLISPYSTRTTSQTYVLSRKGRFRDHTGSDLRIFPGGPFRIGVWSDGSNPEFVGAIDYVFAPPPLRVSYEGWRRRVFTTAQLENPLVSGDNTDVDSDGLAVILEYALGSNPMEADEGVVVKNVEESGIRPCMEISFQQRVGFPCLIYELETSRDLLTWTADQGRFVERSRLPVRAGFEKVSFGYQVSAGGGARFFRLRVRFADER